jgi:signal transduction histidine kinase
MAERKVRVLLVEDDDDDYVITRDLFRELPAESYFLDRVATFEDAELALTRCDHDAYLVDFRLGAHTGLDFLEKARAAGCTAPIIMLTGEREREVDLQAMQAGASDFLLKDRLDANTLDRSIRYALTQRRMEEEIRQNNSQLELRVTERTAELNRLNLALQAEIAERKRAEQALRDADRRKDEFLATLAHELRNPLAPLTAAVQLIAAEPQHLDQVGQLASMMGQQFDQLVRLIDDLVDVSRINSGKLRLRTENVAAAEFISAAVVQSQPLIDKLSHTLTVSLPEEQLVVQGDKVRLAQIVSNLLINAAKYTPQGGRIQLLVVREGHELVLQVRDNGIGIPREMQARIFDLFAQVDSSSTRSHGGLGIGLTIVRTLVEMHNGVIRAASEGAACGSEFTVRLPLSTNGLASSSKPLDADNQPLVERKILLVDDNLSAAHLMCRLLQKLGQNVHVADSGLAALAQVRQIEPQIVISDVAMPGMSGYELAREIRLLSLPQRPYLVAVTGYGQESDRQEALAAGFDKHLTKPVGVATLEQLLRAHQPSADA